MNNKNQIPLSNSAIDWQKKAVAAEKTNIILKAKVIDLYNHGAQSVIHKQLESAKRRDEQNRRRSELMEVRNNELKRYSETLEAEVAARTEAMKTVLDNVKFGFLVVDHLMVVQEEYTLMCEELFGAQRLGGKSFLDLIHLQGREREHYQLGMDQVFEDLLPTEISLGQMPQRFEMGKRVLLVQGSAIRKKGQVIAVLFTVSDTTALEEAQREAATNKILVGILRQKDAFQDYIGEVKEQIRMSRSLVGAADTKVLKRLLHTLKGNAGSWGLKDIAHLIHETEEHGVITAAHIDAVEASFKSFLDLHASVIGIVYERSNEEAFAISGSQIAALKGIISHLKTQDGGDLRAWTAQILQKPASSMLGPIEEFVSKLGDRLSKKVKFELKGEDTLVDTESMRGVMQNLIHLLRNAVDHGIETPEERGSKSEQGTLSVHIGQDKEYYILDVKDDGRGIDCAKLVKKALARQLLTREEAQSLSRQKQLELIFLDGLSSADETTDISGRGVGMSAMADAVRQVGGRIEIHSEAGQGTHMRIRVPLPEVLRLRMSAAA